ncbi:MAG: glycosyltransferase 87 family protein [Actinomycetota bacterium]
MVALVVQLVPLAAPLMLSSDAWTYWMYGRIAAVHDANPYEDPPSAFRDDPAYPWSGESWRDSTSVYAPGFTIVSEPVALVAGESHDAAAWIYKALAALAACATVLLAARLAARPALAAAFVGWNPLLAVHLAGGGHNDAWVGTLLLAALATQAGGAAWAFGAAVKWVPFAFLPLHVLAARRRAGLVSFAVTTAAVASLATWRYGLSWLDAFGPLADNARETTSYALPHRLSQLGVPEGAAIALFGVFFVLAYAVLAREAWRGRARLGLAAVALLACAPYVTPWYLAWVVPLAAVEEDKLARVLALAFTAYLLPQTIPV